MKKLAFVTLGAVALGTLLISAGDVVPFQRKIGFLVPSQCQPTEKTPKPSGPSDEWPAPHTTKCSLREACIKSGYGLWAEDRFFRFDKRGQEMALEYFKTTPRTSYHKVEVIGNFDTPKVAVKKIELVD